MNFLGWKTVGLFSTKRGNECLKGGTQWPLQRMSTRVQNKDLFSEWTTRLKFQLIHHRSQSTSTALRIHAWTQGTTTTFIISLAATSPNAAVLDATQSRKITASKTEMLKPLLTIGKSSNQPKDLLSGVRTASVSDNRKSVTLRCIVTSLYPNRLFFNT